MYWTGSMRPNEAGTGVAGTAAGAAAFGVAGAGATGRARSSTGVSELKNVIRTTAMASEATVPKISVPPPNLFTSGGSGSSGFWYATSGS